MDGHASRPMTPRQISRRDVLRGMGATVCLPFLEAFGTSAKPAYPCFCCIEMVYGSAGSTKFGVAKHLWAPAESGRSFDLSTGSLSLLEGFRDYITIISNTDVPSAETRTPEEAGGDHLRSSAAFLTQARPRRTRGPDVRAGISLDQLYAQRAGEGTPIPSIQLCIERADAAEGPNFGYSNVYRDTISWASPI